MGYDAPVDVINKINDLPSKYYENTDTSPSDESPSSFWTTFGYKDTSTRRAQLQMIQLTNAGCNLQLKQLAFQLQQLQSVKPPEEDIKACNAHQLRQANLISAIVDNFQARIGMCLYVMLDIESKSRVFNKSELYKLLTRTLGITKENPMTNEARYLCLNSLKIFLDGLSPSDIVEFSDFRLPKDFNTRLNHLKKHLGEQVESYGHKVLTRFPIANTLGELGQYMLSPVGITVGAFIGGALAQSNRVMPYKMQLAGMGSALGYWAAGPKGSFFVGLTSAYAADSLISGLSAVSFAMLFNCAFKYLGYASFGFVGLGLDLSVMLISKGVKEIYYWAKPEAKIEPTPNGIRLTLDEVTIEEIPMQQIMSCLSQAAQFDVPKPLLMIEAKDAEHKEHDDSLEPRAVGYD